MQLEDLFLILLILVALFAGAYLYIKRLFKDSEGIVETNENVTLSILERSVDESNSATIRQSLKDLNLTEKQLKQREALQKELSASLRSASYGDNKAKIFVKRQIIRIITDLRAKYHVTEATINSVIPFDSPQLLTAQDKFEILAYYYINVLEYQKLDDFGKLRNYKYGIDGVRQLIIQNGLADKVYQRDDEGNILYRKDRHGELVLDEEGRKIPLRENYYEIDKHSVDVVYAKVMGKVTLSYVDKLEIVAQRIFENRYGLGAVDIFVNSTIDEYQGGTNGIPYDKFDIKQHGDRPVEYAKDSIWIIVSGKKIRVSALSFGSEEELVRVCQNIYKYEPSHVLSKNGGYVTETMKDGSRVVVGRPPFSLNYFFIARKPDSAESVAPDALLVDRGKEIAIIGTKWAVRGMFNGAVSGEQGTGKTTWLKSMIRFFHPDYSIRTQELIRELNLSQLYPERNVVSFVETESVSAQQGLDFQKKTSGDINIVGEVATAVAASWVIQTAKVASRSTWFTHHAKTWHDLIVALRNNVMEVGSYNDDKSVDQLVAECVNVDIHFENDSGHRYIERITYIYPEYGRPYPVEDITKEADIQRASLINQDEYRKRMTDRVNFNGVNIIEYDKDKKRYKYLGMPDDFIAHIRHSITEDERFDFEQDLLLLKELEDKFEAEDLAGVS